MHSAISELSDTYAALIEAAATLVDAFGGAPDLVFVFTTPHHAASWSRLPAMAREILPNTQVVGCSGAGVIGDGHEIEQRCALTLFGLRLAGVETSCHHLDPSDLPASDSERWQTLLPGQPPALTIVLADPLSTDVAQVLRGIQTAWPGSPVVGGLASGSLVQGGHALFCGGRCHRIGAVVVALRGPLDVETVVAQACRPIGDPMLITRCAGRVIQALGDQAPVAVLRELYATLSARDQDLFRNALFVGIEMRGDHEEFHQGDFAIRRITGMDPNDGAISVAVEVQPWQVVQFHLRDERTAAEDLKTQLAAVPQTPDAALMFTCTGRGLHLYGRPDHDTDLVRQRFGNLPIGGLFCAGEIGPVGDASFLHGSTTVLALLRAVS